MQIQENDAAFNNKFPKLFAQNISFPNPVHKNEAQTLLHNNVPHVAGACSPGSNLFVPPMAPHNQYNNVPLYQSNPVNFSTFPTYIPPIGVFWDIENCRVPSGRSALAAVQLIRNTFFSRYKETEFIVVCDVQKENHYMVEELNDAQVNLIHVASKCKNAADVKLKQCIRRFADIHNSPAAIILISNDINFAADLSDIRYRKKFRVILLHGTHPSKALISCADEHYNFWKLMESLPYRKPEVLVFCDLIISNLPQDQTTEIVQRHLKQILKNYNGRVLNINSNTAAVRFNSMNFALRAQKRIDGEFVLGSKVSVKFRTGNETSPEQIEGGSVSRNGAEGKIQVATEPSNQMYGASASITGGRPFPMQHFASSSSVNIGPYSGWENHCAPLAAPPGMIQPHPIFIGRPYANNGNASFDRAYNELAKMQSPAFRPVPASQQCQLWEEQYKIEKTKVLTKRIHIPQVRDATINNVAGPRPAEGVRRARGAANNPLVQPTEWTGPQRPSYYPLHPPSTYNGNATPHSQPSSFKRRSLSPMCDVQLRERAQWNSQNQQTVSMLYQPNLVPVSVNSRTPSPYDNSSLQTMSHQNNRTSPYQPSEAENEEVEKLFNPINHHNGSTSGNEAYTPIELQVTNLDQSINPKKMRHVLASIFLEYVMVLTVSVFMQSDGNFAASVKVPSLPDAQYAISKLHRRKVGYKRILISYAHTGRASPQVVRAQIVMLLQEVPGHKLPLFKFREMYESRFMISIGVSELYKMKDVCIITEDPGGRMVSLNPDHRNTPSPCFNNTSQDEQVELPYCAIHMVKPWSDKGWAEQKVASLPNVKVSLKLLDSRIHQLLTTHNGSLPLPSLPNCYEAEFKEKLHVDENGVPLEHLVSCLSCVDLKQGIGSVKYLVWTGNKTHEISHEENKCVSPSLANQLALFSRELVDLLKTAPHCQLPFNRFIPAYHHHFGRQCRVADYGFTKLIDLLEALTHTVQVMGEGSNRVVTLSHRAQVRRFTSDLLRVLKSKASKQVALSEFPNVYARVIAKPWDIVDYGVCEIDDILSEVSENTVVVTNINEGDRMIAIPKREQTAKEIERTKEFAVEVVELLRHAPQCRMLFNKFVPSYHHHFGHQCRVSDYGFTKLIELFEAIPDVVKIEDDNCGERIISLTEKEGLRVLSEQITKLIMRSRGCLPLLNIAQAFVLEFGYAMKPELFGCASILQIIRKLKDTVKLIDTSTGMSVVTVDKFHLQQLTLQCRRVLMDQPQRKMSVKQFQQVYSQHYSKPCNIDELKQNLSSVVRLTVAKEEEFIELTPLHSFACDLYRVIMNHNGSIKLSQFEAAYQSIIGSPCKPSQHGFSTIFALLQALPCTVSIKVSKGKRNVVYLNKKLSAVGIPLPAKYTGTSSSHRDTDSSNESFESDASLRINRSSNSSTLEERGKVPSQQLEGQNSWSKSEERNLWAKERNWESLKPEDLPTNWSWPDMCRESFLKNLIPTSVLQHGFPPPPPKPDSPPEATAGEDDWESSVWTTPKKFTYSQDTHATSVQVPPLTLPASWNQIVSDDSAANLLSPMKNLLPAAANPLNLRISPFFSANRNLAVVAPHPSELPLPSLALTPKKSHASESIGYPEGIEEKSEQPASVSLKEINAENGTSDVKTNAMEETEKRIPVKASIPGKRRLAAHFSQPIES